MERKSLDEILKRFDDTVGWAESREVVDWANGSDSESDLNELIAKAPVDSRSYKAALDRRQYLLSKRNDAVGKKILRWTKIGVLITALFALVDYAVRCLIKSGSPSIPAETQSSPPHTQTAKTPSPTNAISTQSQRAQPTQPPPQATTNIAPAPASIPKSSE
jgi:hypothetical protein